MKKCVYQKKAKIIYNHHVGADYYRLGLHVPEIAACVRPGQFVTLRIKDGVSVFLRRPFSVHKILDNLSAAPGKGLLVKPRNKAKKRIGIEILYEVVGKGTEILSGKKPPECLDALGPLGNGFSINGADCPVLVAGGMGIAPLLFLAQELQTVKPNPPTILIGARTKKEICSQKEFADMGLTVKISTDDGSGGFKGKVTDLLKSFLSTIDCRLSTIYACGPKPMLKEIINISVRQKLPAQVSLDEYMACGLGVCLGCAVKTKYGQKLVCRDGPVFEASMLKFD